MATIRTLVPPAHNSDPRIDPRASSSEVFVVNSNLALATTNPKDPYTIYKADGSGADRPVCQIVKNAERLPWLELIPIITGASMPAADIVVRAFGIIPYMPQSDELRTQALDRYAPFDFDATAYPPPPDFMDAAGKYPVFIVPLKQLGQATYGPVTFDHLTALVDVTGSTLVVRNRVLPPQVVYTGGAPELLITIDTASSVAGILAGRLTN